uniref:Uncharacterized protein n=1 Tax=Rangifer tarandus platyrhynchus TaxID=3082113 RepID=A0ACB0E6C3_RANTA|nr:unnamed protein product [Rangifer tarandus platyrhynchus]
MHWGTARPRLSSTALVHSRHSEGAAPGAEGVKAALRPSVVVGRATIPPSACCGLGGGGDTQMAPDSVTVRWGLRGNSLGGLLAHEVPAGNGLSRDCSQSTEPGAGEAPASAWLVGHGGACAVRGLKNSSFGFRFRNQQTLRSAQ